MAETATETKGPVIFHWPDGSEFSNDPDYLAQKRVDAFLANNPGAKRVPTGPADDEDFSEYDDMDGAALKAAAKEKGVDITGLKKIGEVRAALIAADEAALQAKAAGDADSDKEIDDEDQSSNDEAAK